MPTSASTPPSGPNSSSAMARLLAQLVTESRLSHTTICTPYNPTESINNWLGQYELSCNRLVLPDDLKLLYISQYLPEELANWVARSPTANTWSSLKAALLETYGVPPEKFKMVVRKRLESLQQGTMSARRFAVLFETVLLDFPEGHVPDDETLRIIYLRVMSPKLRRIILPNVPTYVTWKQMSTAAIAIEESLSLDESLLEDAFSKLSLDMTPGFVPTENEPEVTPMEIDAFHNSSSDSRASTNCTCRCKNHYRKPQDPMRLWTDDGRPICGSCGKVGHLSKKCRSRNKAQKNQQPRIATMESSVTHSSTCQGIQYAAILIQDDPLATGASINFIGVTQAATTTTSLPRINLTVQGHLVQALVDTGANISAVRTSLANKLGLYLMLLGRVLLLTLIIIALPRMVP